MPRVTPACIERAIKRASEKDAGDYKEVIYEGFGPHGIAVLVETATDNTTRTVANLRNYFNKKGGSLGNSGSVAFMFSHKSRVGRLRFERRHHEVSRGQRFRDQEQ